MRAGKGTAMSATTRTAIQMVVLSGAILVPGGVRAQEAQPPTDDAEETRSTGLPSQVEWKFNFDATWGSFGFANSLYQNPKETSPRT